MECFHPYLAVSAETFSTTCQPLHRYRQDLRTVSARTLLSPSLHSSLGQSFNSRSTTCCHSKSSDVTRCALQLPAGCRDADAENPRRINPSQWCVPCFRHGGIEAWPRHCFTLTFSQPISSKCAVKLAKIIQHLPFHHMSHSLDHACSQH